MNSQEQYDFLLSPLPANLNRGQDWSVWSALAKDVSVDVCLKVLREPEPYLTNAHKVALLVLRRHDWNALEIVSNGTEYFEIQPKDEKNWTRMLKPFSRYKSSSVREITDRILDGETVFAKYENEDNDNGFSIYTRNVLKLRPAGFRRFDRFWRNQQNDKWISLGPADQNCDVESMNSDVYTGILESEVDAIIFMAQWLLRAREREMEHQRLSRIFKPD